MTKKEAMTVLFDYVRHGSFDKCRQTLQYMKNRNPYNNDQSEALTTALNIMSVLDFAKDKKES